MKLLIDAGNTLLKWALVSENEWLHSGSLPIMNVAELPSHLKNWGNIKQVWASNVAGNEVARQINNLGIDRTSFIVAQESQCGVHNGYLKWEQLGSDRWAALIAAWNIVQKKCMVVNCGTATTIDSLSDQGKFMGGLILPGMELMQRCTIGATKMEKLEESEYSKFPLKTEDALYSGAIQASCGAIDRQIALHGSEIIVVLSGGAAGILKPHISTPSRVVDNLVLRGLMLIAQEARKR